MLKKAIISLVLLAMGLIVAVSIFSRKAPDILRAQIEQALNKKVIIDNIEYRFPYEFELQGFTIKEKGKPFDNEVSFNADRVFLRMSPWAFSQRALIIDRIEVEKATIIVRHWHGDLYQALSGVMRPAGPAVSSGGGSDISGKGALKAMPLTIHELNITNSLFQYADYDISREGFVASFNKINAEVRDIELPATSHRTTFWLSAALAQGRDKRPGKVEFSGWTELLTLETDATLSMQSVFLPYFQPYYSQVTSSLLEDGSVDIQAVAKIHDKVLDANVGFELTSLHFSSYEGTGELFGLKAEEILAFLKDSSGRLKFQISAQWNISDKSVRLKDIFRKSIERSLRETVLGSVGNILIDALQKMTDGPSASSGKDGIEAKIKKIKDFFKY